MLAGGRSEVLGGSDEGPIEEQTLRFWRTKRNVLAHMSGVPQALCHSYGFQIRALYQNTDRDRRR